MKLFKPTSDAIKIGVRFGIFLLLFILISGIIGPPIIRTKLLYGYGFFIYGGLGKVLIFGLIAFLILARNTLLSKSFHKKLKIGEYDKRNILFVIGSLVLIFLFSVFMPALLHTKGFFANLPFSLFMHSLLILSTLLLLPGVFGFSMMKVFYKTLKKELFISGALALSFYFAFTLIFKLWFVLSGIVLVVVKFFLSFTFPVIYMPPRTLILPHFAISIEQTCSGIESLFMFSALYIIIGIMEILTFNKKKLFIMFPVSLICLFLVNILRVYIIIISGVLISPYVAQALFHTYAGMILFIIYFVIFWKLCYGWMKR